MEEKEAGLRKSLDVSRSKKLEEVKMSLPSCLNESLKEDGPVRLGTPYKGKRVIKPLA